MTMTDVIEQQREARVTRQERILYGELAGAVRRIGSAVSALEQGRLEIEKVLEDCRFGDQAVSNGGESFESDRSKSLNEAAEHARRVEREVTALYRQAAAFAQADEAERSRPQQSATPDPPLTREALEDGYHRVRSHNRFVHMIVAPDIAQQAEAFVAEHQDLRGLTRLLADEDMAPGRWRLVGAENPQ